MATMIINNVNYSGKNIIATKGKIFIDGQEIDTVNQKIDITIQGDVENIDIDFCTSINITGNVTSLKSTSGDIHVTGNIMKSVHSTSGNIEIEGNVDGDAQSTSGDIKCNNISGAVKTVSGNIKYKKE